MPPLLRLFTLANLVTGTGAFVIGGILPPIADDLGVGIAAAGQSMTAYAIATALLAPAALIVTGHWSRRSAVLAALALFAVGNLVCALAPSLTVLLAGRVLMGIGAVYTPIVAGIAVAMVEPARRGKALAFVFLGISLSYIIGVPLGAWFGYRYGWRWPVAGVAVAALLMVALMAARLPRDVRAPGASLAGLGLLFTRPAVLRPLALTLMYFTAIFCVFSYIGPVLLALHPPMGTTQLSLTLASFGAAGAAGTLLGGYANDRFGSERTLLVLLVVLGVMMLLVPLTAGRYAWTLVVFLVWGAAGFGMMAPQQSRLAAAAEQQAALALSLNSSMLYLGTALGAAVGGAVVGVLGFERLAWAGAPFAAIGLAIACTGRTSSRPGSVATS